MFPSLMTHIINMHSSWMEDALRNYKSECRKMIQRKAQATESHATSKLPTRTQTLPSKQPNIGEKRVRQIDKLDAPSPTLRQPTVVSDEDGRAAVQGMGDARQFVRGSICRDSLSSEEEHQPRLPPRRVTRSQNEHEPVASTQMRSESPVKIKVSTTGVLGPPWSKDLVYPQPGRRAAIVPFEDLARLDDDEFLNDNLILFFMRYLETHMEKNNPEVYKRMHFFNTYFYEALTKTSSGKKTFNYDAVSKWTKNINLFNRDFVVVPVNENLHWYVAIICNLPHLVGDSGSSGWTANAIDVDQQSEEAELEDDPPTTETQRSLADLSISDSVKNSQTPPKKRGHGRRKNVRRSLPKYEVDRPVIVTLDTWTRSFGHLYSTQVLCGSGGQGQARSGH